MARLSGLEPTQQRASDLTAMKFLKLHQVADYYKKHKICCEINDGRHIKIIDDNDCKTCKHKLTYFDCSQCHDFDEWQRKGVEDESNKDNN